MAVLFGDERTRSDHAMVIDVTDGWLLQGAWLPPDPIHAFTLANLRVSLMTAKIGVLLRDIQDAQGAEGWVDHVRALIDIGVKVGDGKDEVVQASVPGKPPGADLGLDVVLRNLGWDLGEPCDRARASGSPRTSSSPRSRSCSSQVEELAFVSEDNGGRYLAFSGGIVDLPRAAGQREAQPRRTRARPVCRPRTSPTGGGLRFRRLRMRIGGNELAPRWLLDGISLFMQGRHASS